jgi:hypothetical protein
MNDKTWQHLLALESVDVVYDWHKKICNRELSTRRANEITSAAKQAREYFRNAANAANTVKPLLTFYGIASLARSTLLLLKPGSGEGSLVRGHGLETVDWSATLSGDLSTALSSIGNLKVRTSAGLFNDFVVHTDNRICIHARSSSVDWRLSYPQPSLGTEFKFEELFLRVPDLWRILSKSDTGQHFSLVNELSYSDTDGFIATVNSKQFEAFRDCYIDLGYVVEPAGQLTTVRCGSKAFETSLPQLMHAYVNKMFGSIPSLHIVRPIQKDVKLSELAIAYILSYFLGMLTRYFPTHWVALHTGMKGDGLWPTIHATQNYVEAVFPEMIMEFIQDSLANAKEAA